jgi:two-component system chemotaxis response regulator CheY
MIETGRRPERILVVDDRPMTREIIRDMLECEGFEDVEVAADGMQALTMMSVDDFSLVVTDWDMAPMSGPDLLTCTRHHARMRTVPFVLATGRFEEGDVGEAEEAGFATILLKPFARDDLMRAIHAGLHPQIGSEPRRQAA